MQQKKQLPTGGMHLAAYLLSRTSISKNVNQGLDYMVEIKNIFRTGLVKHLPHLLMIGLTTILLPLNVHADNGSDEEVVYNLPTNGDVCKRCGPPLSPNMYYADLQEFFSNIENQKPSKKQLINAVDELFKKELSDIAWYAGDNREVTAEEEKETEAQIINKLEGFKVLLNVFEMYYGSWGKETIEDALTADHEICAFDNSGKTPDEMTYANAEELSCQKMSIYDVFDLSKNQQMAARLKTSLDSPSTIAHKFVGKISSHEEKIDIEKLDQAYCGILKSKRIREAFNREKSLTYIGNQHHSYACRQVGLFFQRNKHTNKIEPEPDKSFLVYPNKVRRDLADEEIRRIIKEIYRNKGPL